MSRPRLTDEARESITARVLRMVRRTPGMTSEGIALKLDVDVKTVSRICQRLQARGALVNRAWNKQMRGLWFPTDALKQHGPAAFAQPNVKGHVLAMVRDGVSDLYVIAARIGCTPAVVSAAVYRLTAEGRVKRDTTRKPWPVLPTEDPLPDDGWTPQPYVHPIRARALGLRP